jgi:hypothetical protein
MNKGQGATAIGAILLAGVMFKGTVSTPSPEGSTANAKPSSAQRIEPVSGEGPWLASCKYWSAALPPETESSKDKAPVLDIKLNQTGKTIESRVTASVSSENCSPGTDGWGIPPNISGEHDPEISAIITTVPDPIHSHLALDFDRSVEAILLAAEDNHYLSSYYWLPWRSPTTSPGAGESIAAAASRDAENTRERQPGLIILRYAPVSKDWDKAREVEGDKEKKGGKEKRSFSWASYHRVIYLFLVGESPALGVNGTQLQNAFQYEKTLKDNHQATLSIRPSPFAEPAKPQNQANLEEAKSNNPTTSETRLSIIGPFFSGSAASLHEGIEAARRDLNPSQVSISGITGTPVAARELDPKDEHIYRSFGEHAEFEQERFLSSLAATGYDLSRVAVLSEGGTVFGTATKAIQNTEATKDTRTTKANKSTQTAKPPCSPGGKDSCGDTSGNEPDLGPDLASKGTILSLRFPRELSLLRNAQSTQPAKADTSAPPTPYLNLSLKDYTADDTVPPFSNNQSPLSIEAQLMAIAHQLERARTQFILISASNILDDIFLAQFLHRACPNARLVLFSGGDLLFERDVDNAPYIGSISISPYLLTSLDFGNQVQWLYSDFQAEAIYNAASYTFWDRTIDLDGPRLAGYRRYPVPDPHHDNETSSKDTAVQFLQIPLWATAIGADGYYPLGILNWCGSNLDAILPTIQLNSQPHSHLDQTCKTSQIATLDNSADPARKDQHVWDYVPESINRNSGISPSLLWTVLDISILLLCLLHCALLWGAQYWSPLTRDLAIHNNDQPHRRAVHLNIGTSVLAAMAFVVAYPLLRVGRFYHVVSGGSLFAWLTLFAALLACLSTFEKTRRYLFDRRCVEYGFFNLIAVVALLVTTGFWIGICGSDSPGRTHSYAGLFFSYRCLQPLSGVCPLLPILLLLFAWYLWSICQSARLRFSDMNRPRIARIVPRPSLYPLPDTPFPLFVPDDALESCATPTDCCLYKNITCLLITREVLIRFATNLTQGPRNKLASLVGWFRKNINPILASFYLCLFALCIFASHIHSLDRFLFTPILTIFGPSFGHYGPTLYEFLLTALFFPLIMVALSGWFRTILIWGALSRGLLEPLERLPIRFAFTRLKVGSWMNMLRQSGLHIRWRDMSRSIESIRQLVHHPELLSRGLPLQRRLSIQYEEINDLIQDLISRRSRAAQQSTTPPAVMPLPPSYCPPADYWDRPKSSGLDDLCLIHSIEKRYAEFCQIVLESILVPHWDLVRTGFVEECNTPTDAEPKTGAKPDKPESCGPPFLHLAEELIVVRYVALIRAVLVNIRYLMLFVSAAFVLALVAWNSYPFQPHAVIDWCFTILLAMLSIGFIGVFAQMHRNAILSRLTDTKPNELGWDFYLRIITFGAVPVLTWLAYQFPQIGGSLFKVLQPGLQVVK